MLYSLLLWTFPVIFSWFFLEYTNDKLQTNKTTGGRDSLTWYRHDYVVGLYWFMDTQTPPDLSGLYG